MVKEPKLKITGSQILNKAIYIFLEKWLRTSLFIIKKNHPIGSYIKDTLYAVHPYKNHIKKLDFPYIHKGIIRYY